MRLLAALASLLSFIVGLPRPAAAADWPQWLGPQRDSVWTEDGILETFPAGGPKVLWRQPVGGGFAGPAVADGRVFVVDYLTAEPPVPAASRRDKLAGTERLLCLSATDGKKLWTNAYERAWQAAKTDPEGFWAEAAEAIASRMSSGELAPAPAAICSV